jgi:hypothetical protein
MAFREFDGPTLATADFSERLGDGAGRSGVFGGSCQSSKLAITSISSSLVGDRETIGRSAGQTSRAAAWVTLSVGGEGIERRLDILRGLWLCWAMRVESFIAGGAIFSDAFFPLAGDVSC